MLIFSWFYSCSRLFFRVYTAAHPASAPLARHHSLSCSCIPFLQDVEWTANMGYPVKAAPSGEWRPWFVDNQIAGYVTEFDAPVRFTFVGVKQAGHGECASIASQSVETPDPGASRACSCRSARALDIDHNVTRSKCTGPALPTTAAHFGCACIGIDALKPRCR